jgi:hypothetical protein
MITYLITFLIGVATGAAGKYFADKYTDQRRKNDARREESRRFKQTRSQMPQLVKEMKKDLTTPETHLLREFFLSSHKWPLNLQNKNLIYYFEDHPDLQAKVQILENNGYVLDVTPSNTKKYRMTEDFARLIINE